MDQPVFRKPRQFFDTAVNPSHVSFDDGAQLKRNLPWAHYVEARWDYAEPDAIKVIIGEWQVIITGHNLVPLFVAIEDHKLLRVRAYPDYRGKAEHEPDTFATDIRFLRPPPAPPKRRGQTELDLPTA